MKKILVFVGLLSIPAIADELHVFTNGEVADADKINENFEILQASGGGCSAEQQDSTVVITCADGTSAVLASEGTVVAVLEAVAGELLDYETFPTGDVVVVDNNDNILGKVVSNGADYYFINIKVDTTTIELGLRNNDADSSVTVSGQRRNFLYYTAPDCTSEPVSNRTRAADVYDIDQTLYVVSEAVNDQTLFYGKRSSGYVSPYGEGYVATGDCIEVEEARSGYGLLSRLVLPDEISEAAYPLRLKQLP